MHYIFWLGFTCFLIVSSFSQESLAQNCAPLILPEYPVIRQEAEFAALNQFFKVRTIPGFISFGISRFDPKTGKSKVLRKGHGDYGVIIWVQNSAAFADIIRHYGSNPFKVGRVWFEALVVGQWKSHS